MKWLQIFLNIFKKDDQDFLEKLKSSGHVKVLKGFDINLQEKSMDDRLIDKSQLMTIMPAGDPNDIDYYSEALNKVLPEFQIDTQLRVAHFIAQVAHESGSFRHKIESLNYSAAALLSVFGKYFDADTAEECARKPMIIANIVYANRMGNGNTASGDGWKYRGRGLIQLTGRDNYTVCGDAIGINLVDNPDLINRESETAVRVACWYWDSRGINRQADKNDVRGVTKRINGGYNGLKDREEFLERAMKVLEKEDWEIN